MYVYCRIKSNDQNAANHIKNLKVDSKIYAHIDNIESKSKVSECAIIFPEPKKTPVRISAIRKYIITTLKK